VRREEIYQDTLDQLSTLPETALTCPLRVQFAGEEGVDEGGLVKEFFHLVMPKFFRWGRNTTVLVSAATAQGTHQYAHMRSATPPPIYNFCSRALVPMDNDGLRWFWFSAPTEKNLQAYHWYVANVQEGPVGLAANCASYHLLTSLVYFSNDNHDSALDCCTALPL
jgi:hypothetical protein